MTAGASDILRRVTESTVRDGAAASSSRRTAELKAGQLAGRRFLFVTTPFGPFARRFAAVLKARGAQALRVSVNGGDVFNWGLGDSRLFRAPPDEWPAWIAETLRKDRITDVLVFGDSSIHAVGALAAAEAAGIETWVIENGYFRPHWITLERRGVNAYSSLPRSPEAYGAELPPPPPAVPIGQITPHHVINISLYFIAVGLAQGVFKHHHTPFTVPIRKQFFSHVRRFFALVIDKRGIERRQEQILSRHARFFLVCLQREGDSQLVRHSEVKTNQGFLTRVLDSFAAHAPRDMRLVVKNHPLDPGVENIEAMFRRLAEARGVADRVDFIDGGSLSALARASEGVVTVNSTSALSAVGFRRPVKLMGSAFFDMPGLIDQQPLDAFWSAPQSPDHDLYLRFRRHVSVATQVNGNYHNPEFLTATCCNLADAIAAHLGG